MAEAIYTLSALALNPPIEDRHSLAARAVNCDADRVLSKPAGCSEDRPIPAARFGARNVPGDHAIPSDMAVGSVNCTGDGTFDDTIDLGMEEKTVRRASADEPTRRRA